MKIAAPISFAVMFLGCSSVQKESLEFNPRLIGTKNYLALGRIDYQVVPDGSFYDLEVTPGEHTFQAVCNVHGENGTYMGWTPVTEIYVDKGKLYYLYAIPSEDGCVVHYTNEKP